MPLPDAPPEPQSPAPEPESNSDSPPPEPTTAKLGQIIGAVLWSFFGVRKGKHMQRDALTIKPLQVILVGVLLAALIVLALLALVQVVLRVAGQP
jgi:hypothetical protein